MDKSLDGRRRRRRRRHARWSLSSTLGKESMSGVCCRLKSIDERQLLQTVEKKHAQ
jgi:hypothetical protein